MKIPTLNGRTLEVISIRCTDSHKLTFPGFKMNRMKIKNSLIIFKGTINLVLKINKTYKLKIQSVNFLHIKIPEISRNKKMSNHILMIKNILRE